MHAPLKRQGRRRTTRGEAALCGGMTMEVRDAA